LVKIIK